VNEMGSDISECGNCGRERIRIKPPGFFLDACACYMPVNDIENESVLPMHPVGFPEHILFGVLQNLRLLLFIQVIAFVQGFLDADPAIDFPSA